MNVGWVVYVHSVSFEPKLFITVSLLRPKYREHMFHFLSCMYGKREKKVIYTSKVYNSVHFLE